jgi:O-antigen ligase
LPASAFSRASSNLSLTQSNLAVGGPSMRRSEHLRSGFIEPELMPAAIAGAAVGATRLDSSRSSRHRHLSPRSPELNAPDLPRIIAPALAGTVAGAVIAFGGTDPASFSSVEIVLFAFAAFALWKERRECPRAWWIGPALLMFYLGCDLAVARPAAYLAREQLLAVGVCLCGFFLAARAARDPAARRTLWTILIALGLAEALYGLLQYLADWQQVLAFKKIDYTAQATGTYINPNNFAGLLEMLLPLVFARALWEFERWSASARASNRGATLWLRGDSAARFVFSLFGALLLTAALLYSRSRAGIAAAWTGLLFVAAIWTLRRRAGRAGAAIVLCLAILTFAAGAWIGLEPVFTRYRAAEQDLPSRVAVWKDTAKLVRAHPVWGAGPGSFQDAYTRVQTSHLAMRLNHAHNDYLEFAAEWGVPGALLLLALVGGVLASALRNLRRAPRGENWFLLLGCCGGVLSLLLHSAVDFNLHIPANALLFAVLLGLAAALSRGDEAAPQPAERR